MRIGSLPSLRFLFLRHAGFLTFSSTAEHVVNNLYVIICNPLVLCSYQNDFFYRLGLWSHCFRSLPDPLDQYQRRFFVGCRWVYDPFTTGYDRIRGYLLPGKFY
ncbi:unnamed protein product [Parnassius mnemosyne]|uniref:Secreted protein n=1 Tax=Parnassius mnemosyne TaxID=213953 RepID=A0AAV1M003_9NEOP